MTNNYYSRDDVVKLLKQRQGGKTTTDFAEEIGISMQLLSSVLLGSRQPGTAILKFLKLRKAVVYQRS